MQGVTVPKSQPEVAPAKFGFVDNAERINSRACMVCCGLLCALGVGLGAKNNSAASVVQKVESAVERIVKRGVLSCVQAVCAIAHS